MMTFWRNTAKGDFVRCSKDQLLTALNDPRLPDDFSIEPADGAPALAIVSADDDAWYLGYIDLTDGEVVLTERGADDGINPHKNPALVAFRFESLS